MNSNWRASLMATSCVFFPVWKRAARRKTECSDQIANAVAPFNQSLHQVLESRPIIAVPVWGNLAGRSPNRIFIHRFYAGEPGLERIPPAHAFINFVAGKNSAQGM